MEDDGLQISGETTPGEEDEPYSTIPIRILSDYTIYDTETKQVIIVDELLQLEFCQDNYAASGLVRPWFDGDEIDVEQGNDVEKSDNGDSSVSDAGTDRIALSKILEFSVHAFSEDGDFLDPYVASFTFCHPLDKRKPGKYMFGLNLHGTFWDVPRNHIVPTSLPSGFATDFYTT